MQIINLDNKDYFTEGGEKFVYFHPFDCNKCIKIPKEKRMMERIKDEYRTLNRYPNFKYYTKMYGFIDTNLGKGMVYELIKNINKPHKVSLTLQQFIIKYGVTDNLIRKIIELANILIKEEIFVNDIFTNNIIVQSDEYKTLNLFFCDGLHCKTMIDRSSLFFNEDLKTIIREWNVAKLLRCILFDYINYHDTNIDLYIQRFNSIEFKYIPRTIYNPNIYPTGSIRGILLVWIIIYHIPLLINNLFIFILNYIGIFQKCK